MEAIRTFLFVSSIQKWTFLLIEKDQNQLVEVSMSSQFRLICIDDISDVESSVNMQL